MRCPRCGAERSNDSSACGRCGAVAPAPGARPAQPTTGSVPTGPAPWQSTPRDTPPAPESPPRWLPGQQVTVDDADDTGPTYSGALARLVGVALVLEAVVAFGYGLFAALERRGIFAALADDPASVSADEAGRSDLINRVAFITGGVVTAVTLVLVVIWLVHVRKIGARVPLGVPWLLVALLGVVGIAYALALHTSEDVEQITYGYLVFAVAALLLAAAAVLGLVVLRRVDAHATAEMSDDEAQRASAQPFSHPQ